ncbi:MAG: hypothetical protein JWN65_2704 [Solirubrobacterales bacterium]|nr:hypothetical protein [Solirubrobacterales bacterium]
MVPGPLETTLSLKSRAANVAVTERDCSIVTWHCTRPVQAPVQPMKSECPSSMVRSVTICAGS